MSKKPANAITYIERKVSDHHRDRNWEVVNMFTVESLDAVPADTEKTLYKQLLSVYSNSEDQTYYRVAGVVNNYFQGGHEFNFWKDIVGQRGNRYVICEMEAIKYTLPADGVPEPMSSVTSAKIHDSDTALLISGILLRDADRNTVASIGDARTRLEGTVVIVKEIDFQDQYHRGHYRDDKQIYASFVGHDEVMPVCLASNLLLRNVEEMFEQARKLRLSMEFSVAGKLDATKLYMLNTPTVLSADVVAEAQRVMDKSVEVECVMLMAPDKQPGTYGHWDEMERRYPDCEVLRIQTLYHDVKTRMLYLQLLDKNEVETLVNVVWTNPNDLSALHRSDRWTKDFFIAIRSKHPTVQKIAKADLIKPVWQQPAKKNVTLRYIGLRVGTINKPLTNKDMSSSLSFPGVVWQQVTTVGEDGRVILANGDIIDGLDDAKGELIDTIGNAKDSIVSVYVATIVIPRNP